jgi:hypothetical protein
LQEDILRAKSVPATCGKTFYAPNPSLQPAGRQFTAKIRPRGLRDGFRPFKIPISDPESQYRPEKSVRIRQKKSQYKKIPTLRAIYYIVIGINTLSLKAVKKP